VIQSVDAFSVSIIGTSPILAGCGVHSGLMDMDALYVCRYFQVTVIQLGQMPVGVYHS
jgi:hypothetical protein